MGHKNVLPKTSQMKNWAKDRNRSVTQEKLYITKKPIKNITNDRRNATQNTTVQTLLSVSKLLIVLEE